MARASNKKSTMKTTGGFLKELMPEVAEKLGLTKLSAASKATDWEKGIMKAIKKMDGDEFNLFLAQVVMKAASKQIMGVDLTKQIVALKELRS